MQSVCHVLVEGIEKSPQWWWDPFLSKCWLLMNNNNYMVQSKASMIYNCITRDTINTKPANYYCDDHLIWKEHYFYKGMGEDLMYLLVSEYVLNGLIVSVWVRFWNWRTDLWGLTFVWRWCHQTKKRENGRLSGNLARSFGFISLKPLNMTMCHWWSQVIESIEGASRTEIGACIMKANQSLQQLSLVMACRKEGPSENCKLSPGLTTPLSEKVSVSPSPAY